MKKIYKVMSLGMISTLLLNPITTFALTKTETVYSNLDYKGNISKTTINVELKDLEKGEIVDYTNLDNIENINGKEKFSKDSNKITWKSTGKDIVYQGKINSELPIKVEVKYYLDEKEVNPNDILNKSGNVKVIYNFKNTSYDENSGMYNPFVITMVTKLDNKNSDINVTNGKVVNTGTKNFITALAAPGLYENIPISELEGMNEVILTYHTEKYKMNEVYFVISPKLLENVDIEKFSKLDDLDNKINTLQNGVNQLDEGSSKLVEGVKTFNDGLEVLNNGLKDALDGSTQITNGLSEINNNSNKLLNINVLIDTLYENYQNNSVLLLNIQNGKTEEDLKNGIINATALKTDLENKLIEVNAGISMLEQAEISGVITDEQRVQLGNLKEQKGQIEAGIKQYEVGIQEAKNNLTSLPLAAAKLSGANEAIAKILMGLLGVDSIEYINDETINQFKNGIISLTNGISALQVGSSNLTEGLTKLYDGSNQLVVGANSLYDGVNNMHNGIVKVNIEGINKLTNYGNSLNKYSNKAKELVNLSKKYKGFSNENSDTTIFIYKLGK